MDPKNISKKELSEERKKRKIAKRKAKRRAALTSFFIKAACGLLSVILISLGALICQNQATPAVKEEDTFPYTGKCVDAYKRTFKNGRHADTIKIEVHFEDGSWHRWSENTFSDAEIESMIGSNLGLTMGKEWTEPYFQLKSVMKTDTFTALWKNTTPIKRNPASTFYRSPLYSVGSFIF